MSEIKACCCLPVDCNSCPIRKAQQINPIEITSSQTNLNQYNRYPFKDYDEAVTFMKKKKLMPGEIAIAYYYEYDDVSTNVIKNVNCILGIGNLGKYENIIK